MVDWDGGSSDAVESNPTASVAFAPVVQVIPQSAEGWTNPTAYGCTVTFAPVVQVIPQPAVDANPTATVTFAPVVQHTP
jgi:hypothetical protein